MPLLDRAFYCTIALALSVAAETIPAKPAVPPIPVPLASPTPAPKPATSSIGTTDKVGKLGENRWMTPTNQILTPAGTQVELPGMRPQALALSPDGKLLVTTGMKGDLMVIDPVTGKILQKVAFPAEPPKPRGPGPGGRGGPRGPGGGERPPGDQRPPQNPPGDPKAPPPNDPKAPPNDPQTAKNDPQAPKDPPAPQDPAAAKEPGGTPPAPPENAPGAGERPRGGRGPGGGGRWPGGGGGRRGGEPPKPEYGQLSFTGIVFSPDGSRIFLSNVNGNVKEFTVAADGKVAASRNILLAEAKAPKRKEEIPAGLAVSPDGKMLYVCLNLSNKLGEVEIESGKTLRTFDVGVAPYDVVLHGKKAYVSNWGGRRPAAKDLTGPAGKGTLVRVDPVMFIASEGSVSIIDLTAGKVTNELITGKHACAMALSPDGKHVVVCNAGDDTLSVIATDSDQIIEKIWARATPAMLYGAQPNALAFEKGGDWLFVANGTHNAVAVIEFEPGGSKFEGLIPTAWFPGAVVFDSTRKQICVANIKGISPKRSPKPPDKPADKPANKPSDKPADKPAGKPADKPADKPAEKPPAEKPGDAAKNSSKDYYGTLSIIPVPKKAELEKYTSIAEINMRYPALKDAALPPRKGVPPRPVPERVGEPSVFKHVLYIIKENRTYDQVLGDVKTGNGDPSLTIFGEKYTPNLHKIVRDFVLLDNTYCSGIQSADGHQWTDSAFATDYVERSHASWPRSYMNLKTEEAFDALSYSPTGFIWDNCVRNGVSFRNYGEACVSSSNWSDSKKKEKPNWRDFYDDWKSKAGKTRIGCKPGIDSLLKISHLNTVGWDMSVPDVVRAQAFIDDLREWESIGQLPRMMMMLLPNDHTGGARGKAPSPGAQVADNDLAMGMIVEALSHSRFWKETCILAIEDDPQNGFDHVSGYRTTCYVVSPYTKRKTTVSTQYNQTSVMRTIELILGIPPMNVLDATATPMSDCFTDKPDFTPFFAVPNQYPLENTNPDPKQITDPQLKNDEEDSQAINFEEPDRAPEDLLNRILWRAMRGTKEPYPEWAVHLVEDDDDEDEK